MKEVLLLFLKAVSGDPRIAASHISLFVTLWVIWEEQDFNEPLYISRQDIMNRCKLSSFKSYYKTIRALHEYGYINYVPSFNPYLGSLVYLTKKEGTQQAASYPLKPAVSHS